MTPGFASVQSVQFVPADAAAVERALLRRYIRTGSETWAERLSRVREMGQDRPR